MTTTTTTMMMMMMMIIIIIIIIIIQTFIRRTMSTLTVESDAPAVAIGG